MSSSSTLRRAPSGVEAARSAARASVPVRAREDWIDSAKGIGILLVVLGHCLRGMIDAKLFPADGIADRIFFAIYTFHMPMFFFLSGLFVQRRLGADENGFLKGTMVRLLWPYFLWTMVQVVVIQSAGRLVNSPYEWGSVNYVSVLWRPMSQFWFLYVLAAFTLASYLIVPRLGAQALVVAALFVLALRELVVLPLVPLLICTFGIAYALGVLMGKDGLGTLRPGPASLTGIAVPVLSAAVWLGCVELLVRRGADYWSLAALPAALSGSVAFIGLARAPWVRDNAVLGALGRQSMPIFLLHVLFVAGTRIVLNKLLGVSDAAIILVAIVLAGVAGPMAVYWAARRLRIAGWLGL